MAILENIEFGFIILDEGHLIKNTKTKKFQAVRKLKG
jgi:SNF2 family DNA or RNA helicase